MLTYLRYIRYASFLLMSWLFLQSARAGAANVDYCSTECGAEESCNTACLDDLSNLTTCLEYDGGPSNGRCAGVVCSEVCTLSEDCDLPCYDGGSPYFESDCDTFNQGQCDNSCDIVCNALASSGGTSCTDSGGGSTTCGSYGKYVHCDDGVCAEGAGENCVNCSADCICPSTGMPPSMPAAIPANPTFTPTTTADLCQAATSYGFGDEWDCPSWDHLLNFNLLDARCDAKIAALQEIASEVTYLRSWSNALDAAGGCSGGSPDQSLCAQKAEYDAAVADGEAYLWQVNGTPCYIFS